MSDDFLNIKIRNQFPQLWDIDQTQISKFIEYYYEWAETLGPLNVSRKLENYIDVDYVGSQSKFIEFIKNEFLKNFPKTTFLDERFLVKNIKDFYKSKGTQEAYKLLFRILYNEDVEIDYPGKYILRASDGKWQIDRSLQVVILVDDVSDITAYDFLVGDVSGASAKSQKIFQQTINGVIKTEIFVSNIVGEFQPGEILRSKLTGNPLAILIFDSPYTIYPGKWISTDGFLSSDRFLQDNYYYQEFSYVVKSARPTAEYSDIVKRLLHPAGTLLFGEFVLNIELQNFDYDNIIDKMYSKNINYVIPLFEFISLELEETVESGSFSGKFVLQLDLQATYNTQNIVNDYVIDGFNTSYTTGNVLSTPSYGDLDDGGLVEITDTTGKIFNSKVKTKVNNTTYILENYPYGTESNLDISRIDSDSTVNTFFYKKNAENFADNVDIKTASLYNDIKNEKISDWKTMKYTEMLKVKFVNNVSNFPNTIVQNSVISLGADINNLTIHNFIKQRISNHYVYTRDEMVETPSLVYRITNF